MEGGSGRAIKEDRACIFLNHTASRFEGKAAVYPLEVVEVVIGEVVQQVFEVDEQSEQTIILAR